MSDKFEKWWESLELIPDHKELAKLAYDEGWTDGDYRVKERTAQLEQQLTTAKAALEQEEAHTTELCKELAEARAEIDKTYKTWCGRDYMHLPLSTAMGSVVAQARQEAASECIEAIEYEHGILGLAFTLRQRFKLEG